MLGIAELIARRLMDRYSNGPRGRVSAMAGMGTVSQA